MTKELIFDGVIYYTHSASQELAEILSKLEGFVKSKMEIHLGTGLYDRLREEGLIEFCPSTIAEIPYRVSYNIAPYAYSVFLTHDHEDQLDTMTAYFQLNVKKRLNAAFGVPPANIDMSKAIKKVIFNPPATIIFWKDGSKTVVKCDGEAFDPEKGMAMAISRKVLGDSYEYYNVFEKWCKKYKQPKSIPTPQEVAAKYMTPPIIPESAVEEVKRYTKIEPGDPNAD